MFQGGADGFMRAFAADDGELLWEVDLGVGIMAAPITYQLDGIQYVAVLAGWGGSSGLYGPNYDGEYKPQGRLWNFRLNGDAIVPVRGQPLPEITALPFDASPELIADGYDKYSANCMLCHGAEGISGGPVADLRYATEATYANMQTIVREGAYAGLGMPNLGHLLDEDDVDSIRNWILSRRALLINQ